MRRFVLLTPRVSMSLWGTENTVNVSRPMSARFAQIAHFGLRFRGVVLLVLLACRVASAQIMLDPGPSSPLSSSVFVDEADAATKSHLERVPAYVADGQWD